MKPNKTWPLLIAALLLLCALYSSMYHRLYMERAKLKKQLKTYEHVVKQQELNNQMWRKVYYGKSK